MVGRKCVCVQKDRYNNDPHCDVSFRLSRVMSPEHAMGVSWPYVVHFYRCKRGNSADDSARIWQEYDLSVKVVTSLTDVTDWIVCREEIRLLWNTDLKRSGCTSSLFCVDSELRQNKRGWK